MNDSGPLPLTPAEEAELRFWVRDHPPSNAQWFARLLATLDAERARQADPAGLSPDDLETLARAHAIGTVSHDGDAWFAFDAGYGYDEADATMAAAGAILRRLASLPAQAVEPKWQHYVRTTEPVDLPTRTVTRTTTYVDGVRSGRSYDAALTRDELAHIYRDETGIEPAQAVEPDPGLAAIAGHSCPQCRRVNSRQAAQAVEPGPLVIDFDLNDWPVPSPDKQPKGAG